MAAIEAASFPDMDKASRRDVLRKYSVELPRQKAVRATDADRAALGITVEHVGADGLPLDGKQQEATEG